MYFKKYLNILAVAAIMFSAATMSGCNKEKGTPNNLPEWLNTAIDELREAVFAPELEEIVPSVAFGSAAGSSATAQTSANASMRSSITKLNDDPIKTILLSDIVKGDNVDWLYVWYDGIVENHEDYKDMVISSITTAGVTEPNVWVEVSGSKNYRVKYEETNDGKIFFYEEELEVEVKVEIEGEIEGEEPKYSIKFTMHNSGVNEISVSKPNYYFYSIYDDNRFFYRHKENNFHMYMDFKLIDGQKKGIVVYGNVRTSDNKLSSFITHGFEGNDENMKLWYKQSDDNTTISFASYITGDYSFRYMSPSQGHSTSPEQIMIDVRALNIKEISVKDVQPIEVAHEITLENENNEKISGEVWDNENVNRVYVFSIQPLIEQGQGKYHHEFTFFGPFPENETKINPILALMAPGLVSVYDFDFAEYRQIANDIDVDFSPLFNTL